MIAMLDGDENRMAGMSARYLQGSSFPSSTFLVAALMKNFHKIDSGTLASRYIRSPKNDGCAQEHQPYICALDTKIVYCVPMPRWNTHLHSNVI